MSGEEDEEEEKEESTRVSLDSCLRFGLQA